MDQKIDELKSYVEQQFCSRGRKLEEICGNLFEKFWRQNWIKIQKWTDNTKQKNRGTRIWQSHATKSDFINWKTKLTESTRNPRAVTIR